MGTPLWADIPGNGVIRAPSTAHWSTPSDRFRLPPLTLSRRFGIVVLLVVPLVAAVCVVGATGVRGMNREIEGLYENQYRQTLAYSQLRRSLGAAETATLRLIHANSCACRRSSRQASTAGCCRRSISRCAAYDRRLTHPEEDEARDFRKLTAGWRSFEEVLRSDAFDLSRLTGDFQAEDDRLAVRVTALLDGLLGQADRLMRGEATEAREHRDQAERQYRSTLGLLLGASVLALLGTLAVIAWLIPGVVPRARDYSRFASEVAEGRTGARVEPDGRDEPTELGERFERNGLSPRERAAADRPAGRVQRGDADHRERARGL